jgi:hypothetical protein
MVETVVLQLVEIMVGYYHICTQKKSSSELLAMFHVAHLKQHHSGGSFHVMPS